MLSSFSLTVSTFRELGGNNSDMANAVVLNPDLYGFFFYVLLLLKRVNLYFNLFCSGTLESRLFLGRYYSLHFLSGHFKAQRMLQSLSEMTE